MHRVPSVFGPEELCEPEEVLATMAKKARNDVVKARSFFIARTVSLLPEISQPGIRNVSKRYNRNCLASVA